MKFMMTLEEFLAHWHDGADTLLVHTSGSTGAPKPLRVEKQRMAVSARMTCDFLGLEAGHTALLCLPLDYIAGKMMVVRALTRGLRLFAVAPSGHPLAAGQRVADCLESAIGRQEPAIGRALAAPPAPRLSRNAPLPACFDLVAMVPMQVYNARQVPAEWQRLQQVRHLIIGGGAVDDELAAALRDFPHAVWSTYGMTETLSHIALRRLNGPAASEWYTPFEGVRVSLSADQCLVVDAPALCAEPLVTRDIAVLSPAGSAAGGVASPSVRFRILGRMDNVICSGGLKIQAEEVEQQLRPHLAAPFMVTWRPDKRLGQAVVLLTEGDAAHAEQVCRQVLPRLQVPRNCLHVGHLPTTETGKPARKQAAALCAALCGSV